MNAAPSSEFVSSTARRLALRLRGDLVLTRQRYDGHAWLVVKDPLAGRYFRFREEEAAALEMLDGETSLDEIRASLEDRFAPRTVSAAQVHSFIAALYRNALVVSDEPGQGEVLLARQIENRWQRRRASLGNVLAIRFRGVDPDRFLNWLYPQVRWLFSPLSAALAILLVASALLLVGVQFEQFVARLPQMQEFFQVHNFLWLALALGCTKICHELGHGLTCKHFGGECHELGFMLLVFTPCLYCNVSDAWLLPSKWQRAAIASAGMVVELVLAAAATLIWWWTAPGLLNYLCLSVMLLCTVSTLAINGNPLMRFDGYYILSNLIEVPNLAQKARGVLVDELSARCLGLPRRSQGLLPERNRSWFALYTVASIVYRWVVLVGILWFLSRLFKPYGLEIIGQSLMLVVLGGLIGVPLVQLVRFFQVPGRMVQVKRGRLAATCLLIVLVAAAAWLIPLPARVFATLVIEPRDAQRVYVSVPGVLEEVRVRAGDQVEAGQVLAVLSDRPSELEIARLQGKCEETRLRLQSLERRRVQEPESAAEIPGVKQELADLEERLRRRQEDQKRLTLKSPSAGTVLPAAAKSAPAKSEGELPTWSGDLLDPANLGSFLTSETLFCLIGDPQRWEATLVIDQSDVELVAPDQKVELLLEAAPGRALEGLVEEVAEIDLDFAPQQLSARLGGELETKSDASGRQRPANTSYLARVPLDAPPSLMMSGYRGQAKIHVPPQTIAQRLGRFLRRTFHFSS